MKIKALPHLLLLIVGCTDVVSIDRSSHEKLLNDALSAKIDAVNAAESARHAARVEASNVASGGTSQAAADSANVEADRLEHKASLEAGEYSRLQNTPVDSNNDHEESGGEDDDVDDLDEEL